MTILFHGIDICTPKSSELQFLICSGQAIIYIFNIYIILLKKFGKFRKKFYTIIEENSSFVEVT